MTSIRKKMGLGVLMPALLAGSPIFSGSASAADVPGEPPIETEYAQVRVEKAWQFIVAPYLLGPTITGDTQIGRLPNTSIDVDTGTILENLRFGAMVHLEALYRQRIGLVVDVAYMNLGTATDGPLANGRLRASVGQLVVEGFAGYRFLSSDKAWAEVYGGGRYWDNDVKFTGSGTIAGDFSFNPSARWLDPVIGIRGTRFLTDKWSVMGRADIGGFGVSSDLTWTLQAGVGYHFNETWSLHMQYKALSVDYDNGKSGADRFVYDTITHGPLLGVAAKF